MRTAIFFWCLLWGIFPPVQAANGGPICQYAHKKEGLRLATCIHPASSNYLSTDDFDTLFQERFGNSFVESPGTSAYPSFALEGWTGEAGLFMGTYLDGMTQVTIDVREIDLGPDANEDPPATEDLALLQDANYEASLVYATIGGIGVVAIVSTYSYEDGESVTTFLVIDDADYYGFGAEGRFRSWEAPSSGCDDFFDQAEAAYTCGERGRTVEVDQLCKAAAIGAYHSARDAALDQSKSALETAKGIYESDKLALKTFKFQQYSLTVWQCSGLRDPWLVAGCVARAAFFIEAPSEAIKQALEETFESTVDQLLNYLDAVLATTCAMAVEAADACLACAEESCGNPSWSCGATWTRCGSSGVNGLCICDYDVEGKPFCWANAYCNQLSRCADSGDCADGSRCVSDTCCGGGGYCFSDCTGRRLDETSLPLVGEGLTASGLVVY
jgi:hypothetical protein